LNMVSMKHLPKYLSRTVPNVRAVSVTALMGYASTKTTEGFYSRKRLDRAMDNARNSWLSNGGQ
jgi:hypothetical protein